MGKARGGSDPGAEAPLASADAALVAPAPGQLRCELGTQSGLCWYSYDPAVVPACDEARTARSPNSARVRA